MSGGIRAGAPEAARHKAPRPDLVGRALRRALVATVVPAPTVVVKESISGSASSPCSITAIAALFDASEVPGGISVLIVN